MTDREPRSGAGSAFCIDVSAHARVMRQHRPSDGVRDRVDYASSIANSWKEQTLLNIVKLRYADMPIFLEVAQVIAGYQLQSTIGGSFTGGNFNAAMIGPFATSGTATASGTYTDRPTVVYSPLTGVDFLKRLMTPIPPSSVMFLLQAGYAAQRVMPIMLDSVNGVSNGSNRMQRAADPRFSHLVRVVSEAQRADTIEIRIERAKQGAESSVVVFPPRQEPAAVARQAEITKLLGLRPELHEVRVEYGDFSGRTDEIDMKTRSLLEIILEFAAAVSIPDADVADGHAGRRTDGGRQRARPRFDFGALSGLAGSGRGAAGDGVAAKLKRDEIRFLGGQGNGAWTNNPRAVKITWPRPP